MRIYQNLKNFLFLDIETVREYSSYTEFIKNRTNGAQHWEKVAKRIMADENLTPAESYLQKAALYVEYGKIVSVAFGKYVPNEQGVVEPKIGAMGLAGNTFEDEKKLLANVADYLNKQYDSNNDLVLCGHNMKEFDIPYLIKRMIKYGIKLPTLFKNYLSAKSWDQKATDTLYDWRMAGNRFMSLDAIAEFLGFESSKTGAVEGSMLGEFFWNDPQPFDAKIIAINTYCKADVRVLMDLAKRFNDVL